MNPPGSWTPIVDQSYYGRLVRSAYMIKAGEGKKKVAWNIALKESGDYDIFFYYDGMSGYFLRGFIRGMREGQRGGQPRRPPSQQIERHFIVFHEGREEKVVIDLQNAQQGWILIGTFRLENGSARVELTDENKSSLVIADAVKWTKKQ